MTELGMKGVVRAKSQRTTVPGKDGRRAGDLVDRDFTAPVPNRLSVADFTYVRTGAGFVHVAFVVDAFSQAIVSWHAMGSKHTELVLTCLRMATWRRAHDGHPVAAG
jgi:transposase InsO family protein